MICRRGGIDKSDIGAIRIMDTTTDSDFSPRRLILAVRSGVPTGRQHPSRGARRCTAA
jgi:hypothetical protein